MATLAGDVRAGRQKPNWLRTLRKSYFPYLCVLPIVVSSAALVYYPLLVGIYYSFTNAVQTNFGVPALNIPPTFHLNGLHNFQDIFFGNDPTVDRRLLFVQTGEWIVLNAIFHFLIGIGLALLLNRKIRFRGLYRALLIVPWATPQFVAAYGWKYLYNRQYGFFNLLLGSFHLPQVDWVGDPNIALPAVIAVNIWLGIPFMTITLLGGLQSIPTELYEGAQIDGAGPFQRFWNITLPLLRPVAVLITTLDVIWTFNTFALIYIVSGGGPFHRSDTIVTYAYEVAIQNQEYGLGAAYGMVILVILLVFTLVYSSLLRANEGVY